MCDSVILKCSMCGSYESYGFLHGVKTELAVEAERVIRNTRLIPPTVVPAAVRIVLYDMTRENNKHVAKFF